MKKLFKISLLGLGLLTLSACSVKNGPNGVPVTSASSANGKATDVGTQTYGIQNDSSYRGGESSFSRNSMRAPANQVYYFAFASSKMRPDALRAVMNQANYLSSHPNARIRLEGNTDNRGSREYNIGLGWRRDQSVARLLEQQGVRPNQIQMLSYGKERPAAQGNNERSWALNRRVNFIYKAN